MPLPGYRRVQKVRVSARTGRRYNYTAGYTTPGGETISRYAYDTLRLQDAGFANRYELERFQHDMAGSRWFSDIYKAQRRAPTWEEQGWIAEVHERRMAGIALYDGVWEDAYDRRLVSKNGPLAKLLNATGRRPLSGYAVGDSP